MIPNLASQGASLQISLREPSLTADNLGHKAWLASYLLARRLSSLQHLIPPFTNPATNFSGSYDNVTVPAQLLELGSGTGLLGIAAATLFPHLEVWLTDLEAIVPNLSVNVDANNALFPADNRPRVQALDWSLVPAPPFARSSNKSYNVILASDPLYSPQHPEWLFNTIHSYLAQHATSRVVIELPLRAAYVPEVEEFQKRMADGGFALVESGEEVGREDWGDNTLDGRQEVTCWWGVWKWKSL